MKITRRYEAGRARFDVEPGMKPALRGVFLGLAGAGFGLNWWLHTLDDLPLEFPATLAGLSMIALALALGRPVFSVRPSHGVRFRLHLLGIPVLSKTVPLEELQTGEVVREPDGSFTLRFLNAAGSSSLTIERFPTPGEAHMVASLCRGAEDHRETGVEAWIAREIAASRMFAPWFQTATVTIMFLAAPFGTALDGDGPLAFWIGFGVLMTAGTAAAVRREQGVLGHSVDEERIDLWSRQGLFRIVTFRQWLGEDPSIELLTVRKAWWPWVVMLLCLLEAGAVLGAAEWREQRNRPTLQPPDIEIPHPAAVRRGSEVLKEYLKRKEASESLPNTPAQPRKE